jgi:hypothetical protein
MQCCLTGAKAQSYRGPDMGVRWVDGDADGLMVHILAFTVLLISGLVVAAVLLRLHAASLRSGSRRRTLRVVIVATACAGVLASSGCGPFQGYTGPALPASQVAILEVRSKGVTWIFVIRIDGEKVGPMESPTIALLPGRHTITFVRSTLSRPSAAFERLRSEAFESTIDVEAGGHYVYPPEGSASGR